MSGEVQCAKCGAAVTAGARFCMACGSDVSGEQSLVATRIGSGARSAPKASATQVMQAGLLDAVREATLGDYEVMAELGRGGMATVFLAHDIQLDRKVAIKVMSPQLVAGEGMVERFKLEARTAAGLSHPHIIPIYAVRQTDDLLYFVMKFIEGRPLDSIIKQSAPLPVPMVRTIVTKVGEALGYAHRRGVVHRDIKPANIMIDIEGMPIVTDFGIAKVADKQGLTMTGATIGTPTYMSPEQCNAQPITGASDQYSLGVMAYEMLTGRTLYDGDSVMTIMFKHCHEAPPTPQALGPDVPLDLAEAVIRMLQKDPNHRWPSIEDALPHIGGATLAYDDSVRTQMVQFARAGAQREILERVSTPRSPIPMSARQGTAPGDAAATVRLASAPQQPAASGTEVAKSRPPRPAPAPAKSRKGLVAALVVVVLAGGGGAAVLLKPWQRGATPTGTSTAPASSNPDPAAATPPVSPPPAVAIQPESTATPPVTAPAAPSVSSVRIAGGPTRLQVGESDRYAVSALDAARRPVNLPARWRSADPSVASVNAATGEVTARRQGQTLIYVSVDGQESAGTSLTVVPRTAAPAPVVVNRVEVSGAGDLTVPGTARLDARVTGSDGSLMTGRPVDWRSNNERVATVGGDGLVTAVSAGTARITASVGGVSGWTEIRVSAPAAVTPPATTPNPPAQPSAEELRAQVSDVVTRYAQALQAGNVAGVKALYPNMPPEQERQLRSALAAMQNLVVRLGASSIQVTGNQATARVSGEYVFKDGKLPIDNTYIFERGGDAWYIVSIR